MERAWVGESKGKDQSARKPKGSVAAGQMGEPTPAWESFAMFVDAFVGGVRHEIAMSIQIRDLAVSNNSSLRDNLLPNFRGVAAPDAKDCAGFQSTLVL